MSTSSQALAGSRTLPVGQLIRAWRARRRLSQLALACEAGISQRHLSFVESGRSAPSRDMLLRLAERLDVPLRERNAWLLAGGFAPMYSEHALDAPDLDAARQAVETVLKAHEPFPAIAVNRYWELVMANAPAALLFAPVRDPALLAPPLNVLRVSLHPDGLGWAIRNFAAWRAHVLERLGRQVAATQDARLEALLEELAGYPAPPRRLGESRTAADWHTSAIAVPLEFDFGDGVLAFIGTVTVFGTPVDVTLAELAVESFFPADRQTAERLRALALTR